MRILQILMAAIFLIACSPYNKVELGNADHDKSDSKLILIPMEDFNTGSLSGIASNLERLHNFNVSTYTAVGVNEKSYDKDHKQYITNEIANSALEALTNQGLRPCEKAVIVLTNNDINNADFRLRYVFSAHYDRACMSIISTARINPINFGDPKNDKLVTERLMKLINKSIGLNHYKYKVSTDVSSVMYGPIMSPMDLDKVGEWYVE